MKTRECPACMEALDDLTFQSVFPFQCEHALCHLCNNWMLHHVMDENLQRCPECRAAREDPDEEPLPEFAAE